MKTKERIIAHLEGLERRKNNLKKHSKKVLWFLVGMAGMHAFLIVLSREYVLWPMPFLFLSMYPLYLGLIKMDELQIKKIKETLGR